MTLPLTRRLLEGDTTLWPDGNVAGRRLGWLRSPSHYRAHAGDLHAWARRIGRRPVVLIGMGGSSLAPEVYRSLAGSSRLRVLDTTDPATVAASDLDDAFVVVSSKSGDTLEVRALLAHAWHRLGGDGSRFAAITDPGTPLARLARERGFARLFENDPTVGGRYSALSYFGLVPAVLCGYDVAELCHQASWVDGDDAVEFGIAVAHAALDGRDKLTIRTRPGDASFGLWAEQLIAESTGKHGKGCTPVPTTDNEVGTDRFIVRVELGERHGVAAEFFRWQLATAVAGHVMGIDPFDEPDVAESKANTARVLDNLPVPPADLADPAKALPWLDSEVRPGDYVALQAFLPYAVQPTLAQLRRRVRDRLGGIAVTAGFGPRFLHSTGQLHKGGPNKVVALQLLPSRPTGQVPVPGFDYDFATLIAAQAHGDYESLLSRDRRVLRVVGDDLAAIA